MLAAAALLLVSCTATDGDTIRCGPGNNRNERIRLTGIDAPELPGHCRKGRKCVKGDPVASKHQLAAAMRSGPIRIERLGYDRYGRTLALVWAGRVNLACAQLASGRAVYVKRWDNRNRVAKGCGL